MRGFWLLVGGLALAGCSNDVCANVQGTCVALHIDGSGQVATVQILASAPLSETSTATGNLTSLPLAMPVRFRAGISGAVMLNVAGSISGMPVGEGVTTVEVIDGQHTTGAVVLGKVSAMIDAGVDRDGGTGTGGFGGFGGGGAGGGSGSCTPATGCPTGQYCSANGTCQPAQVMPIGGTCTQDGAQQCQSPAVCAPDNLCRMACAATPDCTAMFPKSECIVNFGMASGPLYCTLVCNPTNLGGGRCNGGTNCYVVDWATPASDCEFSDGKNSTTTCTATNDCAAGESCYIKSGQTTGSCYVPCLPGGACASGTCQTTSSGMLGLCCPSGTCT